MRQPQVPSQNSLAMLEWLEQRRLDLIAAYRATLEAVERLRARPEPHQDRLNRHDCSTSSAS
jgi:hypothetical protein